MSYMHEVSVISTACYVECRIALFLKWSNRFNVPLFTYAPILKYPDQSTVHTEPTLMCMEFLKRYVDEM